MFQNDRWQETLLEVQKKNNLPSSSRDFANEMKNCRCRATFYCSGECQAAGTRRFDSLFETIFAIFLFIYFYYQIGRSTKRLANRRRQRENPKKTTTLSNS